MRHRDTHRDKDRHRDTDRHRHAERETYRHMHVHTDTERHRHTDTRTHAHTETPTDTCTRNTAIADSIILNPKAVALEHIPERNIQTHACTHRHRDTHGQVLPIFSGCVLTSP